MVPGRGYTFRLPVNILKGARDRLHSLWRPSYRELLSYMLPFSLILSHCSPVSLYLSLSLPLFSLYFLSLFLSLPLLSLYFSLSLSVFSHLWLTTTFNVGTALRKDIYHFFPLVNNDDSQLLNSCWALCSTEMWRDWTFFLPTCKGAVGGTDERISLSFFFVFRVWTSTIEHFQQLLRGLLALSMYRRIKSYLKKESIWKGMRLISERKMENQERYKDDYIENWRNKESKEKKPRTEPISLAIAGQLRWCNP